MPILLTGHKTLPSQNHAGTRQVQVRESFATIHLDELLVALASLVSHTGQVRISLLAVAPNDAAVIELVLVQKPLRVVVGIDVDLGQGVVGGWFLGSFVDAALQPGKEQLQSGETLDRSYAVIGR